MAGPTIFPAGTKTFIVGTNAPTGWTKDTSSFNNHTLRVTSGSVSPGGTVDFTSIFATTQTVTITSGPHTVSGTSGATTLAIPDIAGHTHPIGSASYANVGPDAGAAVGTVPTGQKPVLVGTSWSTWQLSPPLGGGSHSHTFASDVVASGGTSYNLNVRYVDIILVTKN